MPVSKILIVDDEAHIRKLYTDMLSREKFKTDAAPDGEEALRKIAESDFDLVILDIEMEDTSGLELLKKIKAIRPNLPVILNTAYSIYMSDFNTWMAEDYIVKSSDITRLLQKVKELVPHE
jgi:DNA-binding NtrC family response regulator